MLKISFVSIGDKSYTKFAIWLQFKGQMSRAVRAVVAEYASDEDIIFRQSNDQFSFQR